VDLGDSDGWDLLDDLDLSASSKQIDLTTLRIRQLWMQHTLREFDYVTNAKVVLTPCEDSVFAVDKDRRRAKASVTVATRMGRQLNQSQVQAIVNVVVGGVKGLEDTCVSVQDRSGFVYRATGGFEDEVPGWGSLPNGLALNESQSTRFTNQLIGQLDNVYGPGKTSASVTVILDHTQSYEQATILDPEGQVTRRKSERKEETTAPEASGAAGAASNIASPSTPSNPVTVREERRTTSDKETDYETSSTSTKTVRSQPTIKQVRAFVAADPSLALDDPASGEAPTAEQITRLEGELRKLVEGVVPSIEGQSGDDSIHIVVRPILQPTPGPELIEEGPALLGSPWMDLLDNATEIVVAIAALAILTGMLRRARKRAVETRKRIEELRRPAPPPPLTPEAEARMRAETILDSNPEAASRVLREWARVGG
jgi:flagellar biosynthesis/type III secretory pathway M-ring protein FliF/YscJ